MNCLATIFYTTKQVAPIKGTFPVDYWYARIFLERKKTVNHRSYPLYIAISISVIATLFLTLGAFTGGLLMAPYLNGNAQAANIAPAAGSVQTAPQQAASNTDVLAAYEQALTSVYQDALPSVVNIRVTKKIDLGTLDRFHFGQPNPDEESPQAPDSERENPREFFNQGGGSGFVWDSEGHIITNYHVVAGATDIEVIFANDKDVKAEVVGSDPDADLAVIKVDLPASELKPVKLGDSNSMQVGQLAIAVGNPFGQEFTMTSGIISGLGRTIRSGNSLFSIPEVIQTDAPINPGNSGGPLFNRQGEVIGINTQILSRSGSNSGIGFAVPINIAKRVVPTLIQGDTYQYAWLGISGNSLTAQAAEFRGLPADTKGAVIATVAEDGPAFQAGLKGRDETLSEDSEDFLYSGDIITAANGQSIHDMDDLITFLVSQAQPGDTVTFDVIGNDGSQKKVEVTLGVRPSVDELTSQEGD